MEESTSELGKVVLEFGRLEAELMLFLGRNNIKGNSGRLIINGE